MKFMFNKAYSYCRVSPEEQSFKVSENNLGIFNYPQLPNALVKSMQMVFLSILLVTNGCNKSGTSLPSGDNTVEEGFEQIFDGKTLTGWDGDSTYWQVEDGSLVGKVTPTTLLKTNTFIIWRGGITGDFELKTEFRITEAGNSGINYRSEELSDIPHALKGYQADIDGRISYTGQNYEERGRTTLAYRGEIATINTQPNPDKPESLRANVKDNAWNSRDVTGSLGSADSLKNLIKKEDWNSCHIIAKGNRLQHFINGILMSDVTDSDSLNRKFTGLLGVQVHVGPPMKVEYRNIRLKKN